MIDLHSHVLPGLDDGCRTLAEAVQFVRAAAAEGITTLACTPHVTEENCPFPEVLTRTKEQLQVACQAAKLPDVELLQGAEMMIDPTLADFLTRRLDLTYGGKGRYCLVELPLVDYPLYVERALFDLLVAGFQPILAHPERNARLQKERHLLESIVNQGVLVQINAGSVLGHYGSLVRQTALYFLQSGCVQAIASGCAHAIASDGHNLQNRPPGLKQAMDKIGWKKPTPGIPDSFP
ncbi:MAG: hypothetical protein NTU59_07790 [Coprothermobacterota bacterium]|nr:hypothetical protein [Coprothermobacterota bacterium]